MTTNSDEYAFLNEPGEADIQTDLFYDYRTNVGEPERYRKDVSNTEVYVLERRRLSA